MAGPLGPHCNGFFVPKKRHEPSKVEIRGSNAAGLADILARLATGELPPAKPRKEKPAQFNVAV